MALQRTSASAPRKRAEATLASSVRSLQRGLKVLRITSRSSGIKAGEISRLSGLARPTVYRLLETLEEEGYIIRSSSDNRFRVTHEALSLGVGYDAVNAISQVGGPILIELSHQFIWPFDLSVRQGLKMQVQESTHPRSPLAVDRGVIGRKLPMLRTAAGRCYLAHSPQEERKRLIKLIEQEQDREDQLYLAPKALQRMISETVTRGYAARYREQYHPNTSSIAVPLYSRSALIGSMAVIWITKALSLSEAVEQFLGKMQSAAHRITARYERLQATE